MPVKLTQSPWLQGHDCGGNGLSDREVARIYHSYGSSTTWYLYLGKPRQRIHVRAVSLKLAIWGIHRQFADGTFDEIGVLFWSVVEHRLVYTCR